MPGILPGKMSDSDSDDPMTGLAREADAADEARAKEAGRVNSNEGGKGNEASTSGGGGGSKSTGRGGAEMLARYAP